jgi:hypothetical protein
LAAWLLAAFVLGGCGGSSDHGKAVKQLTVPAYGTYPPMTITVTEGTPALCRRDAEAFTRNAVSFLAPSATPADQYSISARLQFIDFKAHLCDVSVLRKVLSRRLTVTQRRVLVARLGFLGEIGRELTR